MQLKYSPANESRLTYSERTAKNEGSTRFCSKTFRQTSLTIRNQLYSSWTAIDLKPSITEKLAWTPPKIRARRQAAAQISWTAWLESSMKSSPRPCSRKTQAYSWGSLFAICRTTMRKVFCKSRARPEMKTSKIDLRPITSLRLLSGKVTVNGRARRKDFARIGFQSITSHSMAHKDTQCWKILSHRWPLACKARTKSTRKVMFSKKVSR